MSVCARPQFVPHSSPSVTSEEMANGFGVRPPRCSTLLPLLATLATATTLIQTTAAARALLGKSVAAAAPNHAVFRGGAAAVAAAARMADRRCAALATVGTLRTRFVLSTSLRPLHGRFAGDAPVWGKPFSVFAASGDPEAAKAPAEDNGEDAGPPSAEEFAKADLRVGKIVEVWPHPEADKLWCEKIDLGEEEPRQILSGLREFYSKEEMENRTVVVVANLKKSKLRGMDSSGMVLAASNEAHDKVELVQPPEGSEIGERVSLATFDVTSTPPANAKKKGNSVWRSVAPFMKTNSEGVATFDGVPLVTKAGEVIAPSLKDCTVG